MPVQFEDSTTRIVKVPHMGPIDNNSYVLSCVETGDAVIIDAPEEPEKLLNELGDVNVKAIIITHQHGDHTAGLKQMAESTGAPVASHEADASAIPVTPSIHLGDGQVFQVGKLDLTAKHTPGHTPGALCLLVGGHLFTGDTLFPGGPGRTRSPEAFRQVKDSIGRHILPLPDDIVILPGHGSNTTVGRSREEIRDFDSRQHPDDLSGDVEWRKS